jgi:hypothetical protein
MHCNLKPVYDQSVDNASMLIILAYKHKRLFVSEVCTSILQNRQTLKDFPLFMEAECSLSCSQEPAAGRLSESVESSSYPLILFLYDPF